MQVENSIYQASYNVGDKEPMDEIDTCYVVGYLLHLVEDYLRLMRHDEMSDACHGNGSHDADKGIERSEIVEKVIIIIIKHAKIVPGHIDHAGIKDECCYRCD